MASQSDKRNQEPGSSEPLPNRVWTSPTHSGSGDISTGLTAAAFADVAAIVVGIAYLVIVIAGGVEASPVPVSVAEVEAQQIVIPGESARFSSQADFAAISINPGMTGLFATDGQNGGSDANAALTGPTANSPLILAGHASCSFTAFDVVTELSIAATLRWLFQVHSLRVRPSESAAPESAEWMRSLPTGRCRLARVVLDTILPNIAIATEDGLVTTDASISIFGNVHDAVKGAVNDVAVSVNGVPATVENSRFTALNIPLNIGPNIIKAVATDPVGNKDEDEITVTRVANVVVVKVFDGDNQSATINAPLANPLVVQMTDSTGTTLANREMIFAVDEGDGTITSPTVPDPRRSIIKITDSEGNAQVFFTLESRSGSGNNRVKAVLSAWRLKQPS